MKYTNAFEAQDFDRNLLVVVSWGSRQSDVLLFHSTKVKPFVLYWCRLVITIVMWPSTIITWLLLWQCLYWPWRHALAKFPSFLLARPEPLLDFHTDRLCLNFLRSKFNHRHGVRLGKEKYKATHHYLSDTTTEEPSEVNSDRVARKKGGGKERLKGRSMKQE